MDASAAPAKSYIFLDKPYAANSYVSLQLNTIFIHAMVILLAVSVDVPGHSERAVHD